MASKFSIKGFPLSSTPVQSIEDGGYFGSCQRNNFYSSNAKVLNTCSPIKEFLTFKTLSNKPNLDYDSGVVSQESNVLDSINLTSELSYTESNELAELDQNNQNDLHGLKLQSFPDSSSFQDYHFSRYRESSNSCNLGNQSIEYELFPEYELNSLILNSKKYESFKCAPVAVATHSNKDSNGLYLKKQTFKQQKIDFIHELKRINCESIISYILSQLSTEELCKASCVSKEWNEAILNNKKANLRRNAFVKERKLFLTGPSKENRLGMRCGPAKEHKMAFSDLSNDDNRTIYPTKSRSSRTKFDSFIKEMESGHSKLLKCPSCCYASKCQSGKNYVCSRCSYRFCSDCLGPVLKSHTCYVPTQPKTFISSKQSKKNLRRL